MALLPTLLNTLGLILLAHAVYSAHENSLHLATSPNTTSSPSRTLFSQLLNPNINQPTDILLETLLSTLLLCVGVVLASPSLKAIQWGSWAGGLERSEEAKVVREVGGMGGNPYAGLEQRAGFADVRGQGKEFGAWVRDEGAVGEAGG